MPFQFRPAQRANAKPLIGLYSESGAGKTYGALLLARGFVGPKGRIGIIDSERGRGESYADPNEYPEIGGYDVLPLDGDFSPKTYGEAISAAEREKLDALIIDSASHEWEGVGGVLDMAAKNQANGSKGVLVWQQPKIEHQRHFMLRLMQTAIPLVIVCMRAKYPMMEKPKQNGGKEWVRSDQLDPKQSEDILFEMFVHGWIDRAHNFHLTKSTAKALVDVFTDGKPITLDTGRKLADWAAKSPRATQSEQKQPDTVPFELITGDGERREVSKLSDYIAGLRAAIADAIDKGAVWSDNAAAFAAVVERYKAAKHEKGIAALAALEAEINAELAK
jgi:hypothetical protein